MANETRSWDARDLSVSWGEIDLTDGVSDGSFVKLTYDVDHVTKHKGAQGHVTVLISADDGGSLTITLSQSSPTNDRLSAIAAAQRRKGVGLIRKPLLLKHINGTTLAVGPEAWIKKTPDTEFSDVHSNREWVLDIAHLNLFVGGSTR